MPAIGSFPAAGDRRGTTQPTGGGGGGGQTGIQGTVRLQSNSAPRGGGYVQLFDSAGTLWLAEAAIDPSLGTYSFTGLTGGTQYRVRCDPRFGDCMGDSEPFDRAVTPTTGNMSTQDFVVQPTVVFKENFQGLSDSSKITGANAFSHGNIPSGYYGHDGVDDDVGIQMATGSSEIQLTTDWPDGSKCMRYNFPNRNGNLGNYEIQAAPRNGVGNGGTTGPAITTQTLCCSWLAQYGVPVFKVGDDSQGSSACEYKAMFNDALSGGGGNCGWLLEFDASTNPVTDGNIQLRPQLYDDSGGLSDPHDANPAKHGTFSGAFAPSGTWNGMSGAPHRFMALVTGIDTASAVYRLYVDDALAWTSPTRPWHFQVGALTTGWFQTWQVGANINNGPSQAQSILFRELQISQTRSSLRSGARGYGISG